jgi:hypothetical protein
MMNPAKLSCQSKRSTIATNTSKSTTIPITLKAYINAATGDQKMMMRPNFRMPPLLQQFSPPCEVRGRANARSLHAGEQASVLSSSIICGDPRYFSGDKQFLTTYQKSFSFHPQDDTLYTSNCETFRRNGSKPSDRSPVQVLAFNFANKITASRGFESAKCGGGGKTPTRRAFEAVDVNGDRSIDRDELQIAVHRMGFPTSDCDLMNEFFAFLAGSGREFIDYAAFSTAIERIPPNIRACW